MAPNRWEKTKSISKKGFDKAWDTVDKLGGPVNRLSNKLGAEAFWPMTIDKEADKAARILRSFCKDGFYAPESTNNTDENGKINRPKGKQRVIQKIPSKVLRNAKGIAIFTTMRTGLWMSGSGGSGVLLGRLPETGAWSPPSGIMLHTAGIGFLAGVDIYDCVVIINTTEALEAFKKFRCTLGGEISAAAGPVGIGGVLESEVHKRQAPIWTYMKSKGLYAGVAVDGTIIIERTDENERFYGERLSVDEILSGKVRHPPYELETLMQTLKAAQGDSDVDESLVPPPGETPGDLELTDEHPFGVPAQDDPDPYGVKALEAEGLFIREAGTKVRPNHEIFEFRPNLGSPIYSTFSRRSADSSPRNSWRASVQSSKSYKSYTSVNRGTQTDDSPLTEPTSVSRASSRSAKESQSTSASAWDEDEGSARWDTVVIHGGEEEQVKFRQLEGEEAETRKASASACDDKLEDMELDDEEEDYEIHEVGNAMVTPRESLPPSPTKPEHQTTDEAKRMSPSFIRARLVTIPARGPPALPPRHPQHVWGSGSSRESTSPTAPSYESHNTSPATDMTEATEHDEHADESSPLAKHVKAATALSPAVDEDEKEEFLSANGDEPEIQDRTITLEDHTSPENAAEENVWKNEDKELEAEESPQPEKTPNLPNLAPNVKDTPEVEETLDKIEAKLEAEVQHPEGQPSNKSYAHVLADNEGDDESPRGTKIDTTLPHARAD